jgi:hypothetical protein
MTSLPPLCGRPTANGKPCRRQLIAFGPHLICPSHPPLKQTEPCHTLTAREALR